MCYDEKWRANIDQRNVAVTFIFKRSIVWLAEFLVSSSNRYIFMVFFALNKSRISMIDLKANTFLPR